MKNILYSYEIGIFDLVYLIGLDSASNQWEEVYFLFLGWVEEEGVQSPNYDLW